MPPGQTHQPDRLTTAAAACIAEAPCSTAVRPVRGQEAGLNTPEQLPATQRARIARNPVRLVRRPLATALLKLVTCRSSAIRRRLRGDGPARGTGPFNYRIRSTIDSAAVSLACCNEQVPLVDDSE